MAGLTYLFAKTPIAVVLCAIAMFLLLAHPLWNLWWIEDRTWRRLTALSVLAIGLAFMAFAAWPDMPTAPAPVGPSRVSLLSGKVLVGLSYVVGWPWRWMLASLVVGFVLASMLHVLRSPAQRKDDIATSPDAHGCQDEWLHEKLKEDKSWIKDLVRFPGIIYNPDFQKAQIDFGFSVFNNSLCDVVIENSVSGEIHYGEDNDTFYYPPKFFSDTPIKCASRSGAYFVIRQALRQEEISRFRDVESVLIWFYALQINFQGTERFPDIGITPFNTNHHVETRKRFWRDWDRLEFIFGYTEEQWTEIRSGSVENAAEVKRLRTELNSLREVIESKTLTEQKPALGLVFLNMDRVLVYYCEISKKIVKYENKPRTATWRMQHPSFWVIVAYYRNEPQTGKPPAPIKNVTAELTYNGTDESYVVPRGIWFPENTSAIDIPYNDSRGVIIAKDHGTEMVYGHAQDSAVELGPKATVNVRLFSGTDGAMVEGGKFEIRTVKTDGNQFDVQATKIE